MSILAGSYSITQLLYQQRLVSQLVTHILEQSLRRLLSSDHSNFNNQSASMMSMYSGTNNSKSNLEATHPGFAYELLELQMAVEDEKLTADPSITEITKLLQLYMIGVEVLEGMADPRFSYFNNKIHSLMMKKHVIKKLHSETYNNGKELSMTAINKAELQGKKDEYQINRYFNQGQVDSKKIKQMLVHAENRQKQMEGKIDVETRRQQDRLEERIKERRMRSEVGSARGSVRGSVKKSKLKQQGIAASPLNALKDSRFEYFDSPTVAPPRQRPGPRQVSGSLQKILSQKYGKGADGRDPRDAI